jgi:hypothetical protein
MCMCVCARAHERERERERGGGGDYSMHFGYVCVLGFSYRRKVHLQASEVLAVAIVAESKGLFTLSSVK